MADTAEVQQFLSAFQSGVEILNLIHSQYRRKFFNAERIILANAVGFADQHLGIIRNLDSSHLSDLNRALSNDLGVQFAVDHDGIGNFFRFLGVQDISAALDKFGLNRVINCFYDHYGLFGSANHTIVKSLTLEYAAYGHLDIAGFVHDSRSVTRAYAESRYAAGVSSFHHTWAAGCEDHIDILMAHEVLALGDAGFFDPGDNIFGSAGLYGGIQDHLGSGDGALFSAGVRAEDDTVTGLQRQE